MNRLRSNLHAFLFSRWFYSFFFALLLALMLVRQHNTSNFNCEICADKAGYYMYLPAAFQLGFRADNYPQDFDHLHGDGFHLQQGKVITKFSCGLALLLSPFYALGTLVSRVFSLQADPYSGFYLFFADLGAAFYAVLGLFFLRKWLEHYVSPRAALLTGLLAFAGTHLLYYTLDETLMSHLYSFTLFAGLLYAFKGFTQKKTFPLFVLFAACWSLAILIRPTNVLFGLIALLADTRLLRSNLQLLFRFKYIFSGALIFLLVIFPQLLYWKFAFGHYVVWSYEGEGFTNWNRPQLLTVWFSTLSGLFPYTPLLLLSLVLAAMMRLKKIPGAAAVFFTFFAVSYLCAAWHNPFFGLCNFGQRPIVEYLPVLLFPFAFFFAGFSTYAKAYRIAVAAGILLCVYYNQVLFSAFDTCFPGGQWDWAGFFGLLRKGLTIIR